MSRAVTPKSPAATWFGVLAGAVALLALYAGPLTTGFLNDDYFFLESARGSLIDSLTGLGVLGNYYRPLSRQIYFNVLAPLAGGNPLVFHAVNFAVFLAALALLADLLRVFLPRPGVMAGVAFFALLPFQRVNLTWVSCSQDLLALMFVLASLALYRRGRTVAAAIAVLAAMASKEAAWPAPLMLIAWDAIVERRTSASIVRRAAPALALGVAWIAFASWMRATHAVPGDFLRFAPTQFAAGYVHMVQAMLGLDHPAGFLQGLATTGPDAVALALLAALAWWVVRPEPETPSPLPRVLGFAAAWLLLFGLITGPAAHTWSSYYYTVAAVGGALLVGFAARRIGRLGWLALVALLAWWHAGSNAVQAFAVDDRPWGWTSHLTSYYFDRAARVTRTFAEDMRQLEPSPPDSTRFFFALLPPWAGFQMGNGAQVRAVYDDPTLQSYFYSQFSPATSGNHPNRFLYWNGTDLVHLYGDNPSPFFRVGCDLLLLDAPAGAVHAFERGLAAGENAGDIHYWLGWAELWTGNRAAAERAWAAFGAEDDSVRWLTHVHAARKAMFERSDSLEARRHLLSAVRYGIGRPEGHAALGQLLMSRGSRFGALELKVAAELDPYDWRSRRTLLSGLVDARLDVQAEEVFEELEQIYPEWRHDSLVVAAVNRLRSRGIDDATATFAGEDP